MVSLLWTNPIGFRQALSSIRKELDFRDKKMGWQTKSLPAHFALIEISFITAFSL
jgi:hypothetical protein